MEGKSEVGFHSQLSCQQLLRVVRVLSEVTLLLFPLDLPPSLSLSLSSPPLSMSSTLEKRELDTGNCQWKLNSV